VSHLQAGVVCVSVLAIAVVQTLTFVLGRFPPRRQ